MRVKVISLKKTSLYIPEYMHEHFIGAEGLIKHTLPVGATIRFDKHLSRWTGSFFYWIDLQPIDDKDIYDWIVVTKFTEME